VELLGTSYAVDPISLSFWQRLKFKAARIGYRVDASSGAQSLQMLLPVSLDCDVEVGQLHAQFLKDLPYRLSGDFSGLEPDVVAALFSADFSVDSIDESEMALLRGFIMHRRELQSVIPVMQRCLIFALNQKKPEVSMALMVAIKLLLQRHTHEQIKLALGLSKNEQMDLLKQLFSDFLPSS